MLEFSLFMVVLHAWMFVGFRCGTLILGGRPPITKG